MCMILENVSLVLVEMNRQDIFRRLYFFYFFFFPSSLVLFGIRESLWSSFAGGRQYGVWAGEWHSSCSCLPQWWSSPLAVNALLTISQTLFQRALWTPGNPCSKGVAPAMAHPKVREEERSCGMDAGSVRSSRACCLCRAVGLSWYQRVWFCCWQREELKLWVFMWPCGSARQGGGFLLAA